MQRRWKFLAITVTAAVAASMALTSLVVGSTAATKVRVLMAFTGHMAVSPSVVKAGTVTFVITNTTNIPKKVDGILQGSEVKRFVLLKTNLAPDKLPATKTGHALEKGRVGRAVVIAPGNTETITLNLKPGKYVATPTWESTTTMGSTPPSPSPAEPVPQSNALEGPLRRAFPHSGRGRLVRSGCRSAGVLLQAVLDGVPGERRSGEFLGGLVDFASA